MSSCIFCDIISGQANSFQVFENDIVMAFMDINPVNKGHILIVPKRHSERFSNLTDQESAEMFSVARKLLIAVEKSSVLCEGSNLFLSDGELAGQEVPHSHLHIVPRFKGDGHRMGFSGVDAKAAKRDILFEAAESIKSSLSSMTKGK